MTYLSKFSPFWALAICGWYFATLQKPYPLSEAYESLGFILRDKNFSLAGWHLSLIQDIYQLHLNELNRQDILRPDEHYPKR